MLHLANGEATAVLLRQAGLEGEVGDVDDVNAEGPLGVAPEARARHLAARLGVPADEWHARRRAREALLERALLTGEVVFWTEEDLHCQANLCEALRRFPPRHGGRVLVAAPARPEERLGHLTPAALAARLERAAPLSPERLRLAHRAWDAFCSPDPRDVERLLAEDHAPWPALHEGLLAHLRRFPDRATGLDVVEAETLRLLDEAGPTPFPDLFAALQRAPAFWALGMGDVQVAAHARDLAPLVRIEGDAPPRWTLALGAEGRAVLEGRADGWRSRGLERWVGGARLGPGGEAWRWDEERRRLLRA